MEQQNPGREGLVGERLTTEQMNSTTILPEDEDPLPTYDPNENRDIDAEVANLPPAGPPRPEAEMVPEADRLAAINAQGEEGVSTEELKKRLGRTINDLQAQIARAEAQGKRPEDTPKLKERVFEADDLGLCILVDNGSPGWIDPRNPAGEPLGKRDPVFVQFQPEVVFRNGEFRYVGVWRSSTDPANAEENDRRIDKMMSTEDWHFKKIRERTVPVLTEAVRYLGIVQKLMDAVEAGQSSADMEEIQKLIRSALAPQEGIARPPQIDRGESLARTGAYIAGMPPRP